MGTTSFWTLPPPLVLVKNCTSHGSLGSRQTTHACDTSLETASKMLHLVLSLSIPLFVAAAERQLRDKVIVIISTKY